MDNKKTPDRSLKSSFNKSKMWPQSAYTNMDGFALLQARQAYEPATPANSVFTSEDTASSDDLDSLPEDSAADGNDEEGRRF